MERDFQGINNLSVDIHTHTREHDRTHNFNERNVILFTGNGREGSSYNGGKQKNRMHKPEFYELLTREFLLLTVFLTTFLNPFPTPLPSLTTEIPLNKGIS